MIIGKDTHLYRQHPAEPNLSDLNLSCSFCLFLSRSINLLHLWPASARSRTSLLIDALVWLKSSSDYHYRREFWKEKITFCLSWPWREVQEETAVLLNTLALIKELSISPETVISISLHSACGCHCRPWPWPESDRKPLLSYPEQRRIPCWCSGMMWFIQYLFTCVKWLLIRFIKD